MGLEKARKYRRRRANALEGLRTGRLSLRRVLREGHQDLGTCPVWAVLMSAKGMGTASVRDTLEHSRVYAMIPLGDLSLIERKAILAELPQRIK